MRRILVVFWWILTDIFLFVGAYIFAYFLRVGFIVSKAFPLDAYIRIVVIIAPFWLGIMIFLGIFSLHRMQSSWRNMAHILFTCVMGLALFALTYYFVYDQFFSRLLLVYAGIFSTIAIVLWHSVFDVWQRKILRRDPPAYPVLFVGINRETERMITLLNERESVLKPVAILDSRGMNIQEINGVPVCGKLHKLEEILKEKRITHLMQCDDLEQTINLLSVCRSHRITYMLLPSVLGIGSGTESVELIEGQPITVVST